MTTRDTSLTGGWKPSQLMVRTLSAFVILLIVISLILAGTYGAYVLVLLLGGLALWEFIGLSEGMGSRAPAWLLFPLGIFFAFSGTVLKGVDVNLVLAVALVGGLAAFLVVPGRRQGLGRWAMGLAGGLYIGMPFNFYLLLYTSRPDGLEWALFTILAVVASDVAALLVGSRIGRHPFFHNISPR
ncbi:MAG: phosphatidate cytidylyltransferase, partial [Candidatus Dormiibacterota bacterium]